MSHLLKNFRYTALRISKEISQRPSKKHNLLARDGDLLGSISCAIGITAGIEFLLLRCLLRMLHTENVRIDLWLFDSIYLIFHLQI